MDNKKQYIIDTNVLLEDPDAIFKLHNGNQNNVFIPYHVLLELDKFKKISKLDKENNGLNWIVKKFKGCSIYSHIVLKGDKSRGPITDLVIQSGL